LRAFDLVLIHATALPQKFRRDGYRGGILQLV
jgi:hypothetical protein